MIPRAEPGLA